MELNKDARFAEFVKKSPANWKIAGFTKVPNRLIFDKRKSKVALIVYTVLQMRTFKKDEYCYPSIRTIASDAGCCKNTAIKGIRELESLGYLRVERAEQRSRKTNKYSILQPRIWGEK